MLYFSNFKSVILPCICHEHLCAVMLQDSEARRRSWSEMLVMVLQLFLHLPDPRFHPLLPAVFFCVNQLICHAQEPSLRDVLAQWFQRLGQLYNFGPKTQSPLTPPVPQPH